MAILSSDEDVVVQLVSIGNILIKKCKNLMMQNVLVNNEVKILMCHVHDSIFVIAKKWEYCKCA